MPSSPVQKGLAVAWGISSTVYTAVATALSVNATEQSTTKDAKMVESADPVYGNTVGIVFYDFTKEIQLRVYPKSTTKALAATAAAALPDVGDLFVITDSGDGVAAGNYIVMKVGRTRKVGDKVEFDITIKAWETDITATAS